MSCPFTQQLIKHFFIQVYRLIKKNNRDISEVWCELSDLTSLSQFNEANLKDFIDTFEFISIEKGNYINYLVINKILFIVESLNFLEFDIRNLSELLDYSGFEALIQEILSRNNYLTLKNFRFVDKSVLKSKTSQMNYEIDVIGRYSKHILIIDAKQWKRKDSYGTLTKAADLQDRRVKVLKKNPDIFLRLLRGLNRPNSNINIQLPFILIPVIVTLEDNTNKLNYNQIPLVSIYEFNAFLQELHNNIHYFKTTQINEIIE